LVEKSQNKIFKPNKMEIEKKKGNKADPHQAREFTTVCT